MKRVLVLLFAMVLAIGGTMGRAEAGGTLEAQMGSANYREVSGDMYSWAGFPGPCNVPTQALILLEKQGPLEVILGDTFTYFIQISNRSEMDMISVTLDDVLPEGVTVMNIEPQPTSKDEKGRLRWNIGSVPAKTAKRITVTARADRIGCLATNSLARICYEIPLPLAVRVVKCNVDIKQELPEVADLCDPITMKLTAQNVGSGPAHNVVINDQLPDGLLTADGKSSIQIPVGTMAPYTQQAFTVQLKATKRGTFSNTARITGDRDCEGTDTKQIRIIAPDLSLAAAAPAEGYICTNVPYQIKVSNKGDSPAKDVILVHALGGEFIVTDISDNGKFGAGRVVWNLGVINPGQSRTVAIAGAAKVEGAVVSNMSVTARCAEPKKVSHELNLVGVAGVLTAVSDNCDPVQLGSVVTYTVTASNTGSRNDYDVQYAIDLDEGMEFVSGAGITAVTQTSPRTVTFAPLKVLAKGQTAEWKVNVRAVGAGDKRFTTRLVTRSIVAPVMKSESTNFYQPKMRMVEAK